MVLDKRGPISMERLLKALAISLGLSDVLAFFCKNVMLSRAFTLYHNKLLDYLPD